MGIIMRRASRAFPAYRGEVLTIGENVIFARPIYAEIVAAGFGPSSFGMQT
jgi:hypothetical protein